MARQDRPPPNCFKAPMHRFPPAISLRQIQYFLAAAETLNFTSAARQLCVTQPTLSHQIAQLEEQIGTPLFDRPGKGKGIRLTRSGAVLQKYCMRAVQELESGHLALAELEGLSRGELRIGVIQSFSKTLLAPILGTFVSQHRNIRVEVSELTGLSIEEGLHSGDLDLGIAFAPASLEGTEVEPLLEERLLLVVGPSSALFQRKSVRLSELESQALVLLESGFSTRRLIDTYFGSIDIRPNVMCTTNSIEIMLGLVAYADVATIVPECALPRNLDGRKAIQLIEPAPVRTSAILWPRNSFRSAAARRFAELVRSRFLLENPAS